MCSLHNVPAEAFSNTVQPAFSRKTFGSVSIELVIIWLNLGLFLSLQDTPWSNLGVSRHQDTPRIDTYELWPIERNKSLLQQHGIMFTDRSSWPIDVDISLLIII